MRVAGRSTSITARIALTFGQIQLHNLQQTYDSSRQSPYDDPVAEHVNIVSQVMTGARHERTSETRQQSRRRRSGTFKHRGVQLSAGPGRCKRKTRIYRTSVKMILHSQLNLSVV